MSADIVLTGDVRLNALLKALPENVQRKYARQALGRGMTILVKAAKAMAPVGETGALKASIGKRFKRDTRSGVTTAKVGINVGRAAAKTYRRTPHGHLVALGTGERVTKDGKSTGRMPANSFFRDAANSVEPQVKAKIIDVLWQKISQEARK